VFKGLKYLASSDAILFSVNKEHEQRICM